MSEGWLWLSRVSGIPQRAAAWITENRPQAATAAERRRIWEESLCPKLIHWLKHFYYLFLSLQQFFPQFEKILFHITKKGVLPKLCENVQTISFHMYFLCSLRAMIHQLLLQIGKPCLENLLLGRRRSHLPFPTFSSFDFVSCRRIYLSLLFT